MEEFFEIKNNLNISEVRNLIYYRDKVVFVYVLLVYVLIASSLVIILFKPYYWIGIGLLAPTLGFIYKMPMISYASLTNMHESALVIGFNDFVCLLEKHDFSNDKKNELLGKYLKSMPSRKLEHYLKNDKVGAEYRDFIVKRVGRIEDRGFC